MSAPRIESLPGGLANLADFEAPAQARVDAAAWAYLNGGAADEITLRANRAAWDALRRQPRVLRDLAGGHTRVNRLGRELRHPILLAPIAYQRLFHADGELAIAHAAAAQEAGRLWFQLYWRDDRDFMRALLRRIAAAGYQALVLTVDAPVNGARDRERRLGFKLPDDIRAVNLGGVKLPLALQPGRSALFDGLMPRAATWAQVDWLRAESPRTLLLKGVTHADDAREALARGVTGLVVSKHGGRALDTLPATAQLLPPLRAALGPDVPLLVDGGIRRGTDVLKAIALGANAVLLGRPYVHALRLLRDELEIAMALCGCKTLADAGPALLWPGSFSERNSR